MVNDLSATCCSLMPLWIPRARCCAMTDRFPSLGTHCSRSRPTARHIAHGVHVRTYVDVRASRPCRLDDRPLHPIPVYCARRVTCLRDAHRVLHNDVTLRHERLQRHMVPACPVRRHDDAPLSCNSLAPSLASHPH